MNTTVVEEKKRVAENLHELLTPRGLAYWFMGDGHSEQNGRVYKFSTLSFPKEDQSRLVQVLKDNFSIHATIQNFEV